MEASLKNTPALLAHINKIQDQLLSRFLNILEFSKPAEPILNDDGLAENSGMIQQNKAAANTFRIDVETTALIRATEDILTLTRQMKELWLFGSLNTLSEGDGVRDETEENAEAVAELLKRLVEREGGEREGMSVMK